jgi:uncharacterized membrane protein
MNNVLALTRLFPLEVLVCLVILLSMAIGVVGIGAYRRPVAISRYIELLARR